jgi:ATP/maltotriose-dependent transcriptional regulator MalT
MLAGSRGILGIAALERGDHQQALSLLRESLVLFHELKMGADIASALEGLAQTAVAQGDARRALCLAGAAAQLRETIGVKRTDQDQSSHDAHMKKAREGLSAEVAERAFADGYEMPLERAVEYALGMISRTGKEKSNEHS